MRAILSVKYTPVGHAAARAVAGFARYVQYRDHHELPELAVGVEGLTRYVAHRDHASPQGRLFDAEGTIGDRERKQLVAYVRRSIAQITERPGAPARAVYRLVISPEDARGLDLRRVARAALDDLSVKTGGLPPWIAAEHRNTAHPHVHVILPAFREVEPGRFRQLVVTKPRLASMKTAMSREIELQRGVRTNAAERRRGAVKVRVVHDRVPARRRRRNYRQTTYRRPFLAVMLARAAIHYRAGLFRQKRELDRWFRERDQEVER